MGPGGEPRLPQVQDEEPGPAPDLQDPPVPAAGEHPFGSLPHIPDGPVVERDRPLVVVGAGRRVVIQEVRPLGVRPVRHGSGYRPENVAFPGPCSRNVRIPAFWSSVENRSENSSRSRTTPALKSPRPPQLTAVFAARSAASGPFAYRRAASTALANTSSAGNTAS